jgi:hypothetical protein
MQVKAGEPEQVAPHLLLEVKLQEQRAIKELPASVFLFEIRILAVRILE